MIARRLRIEGVVQGVGFRYAMLEVARGMEVAGWVRNRRDGSVEAFAQGHAEAVEGIVTWARRGPPAARVTAVDIETVELDATAIRFELRPTN